MGFGGLGVRQGVGKGVERCGHIDYLVVFESSYSVRSVGTESANTLIKTSQSSLMNLLSTTLRSYSALLHSLLWFHT